MRPSEILLIEMTEERKWRPIYVKPPMVVGRKDTCDIIISGTGVSGKHAEIIWEEDNLICVDLESTNGTRLNGTRMKKEILRDGDCISFGEVAFTIKISNSPLPRLYLPEEKRIIALGMFPFLIGRHKANHLKIESSSISSQHAKIYHKQDGYHIKDAGSTNGTRINGNRIESCIIKDGDSIQLGRWNCVFLEQNINRENFCLQFLKGENKGKEIEILEKVSIGRTADNEIVIPDSAVSSHHCTITWSDGSYWLEDLDSSNGTRIRGRRIKKAPIQHGDEISVSIYPFLFYNKTLPLEKSFLVFIDGELGGEEIALNKPRIVIGRDSECEIAINSSSISKRHAEIIVKDGAYTIQDLESTNGTLVNEKKIESVILQHGDKIQVGKQKFIYRSSDQASPKELQEEKFVLIPLSNKGFEKSIPIDKKLTIGRSPENDIVLKAQHVSGQHAVIHNRKGIYILEDCKSLMGTFINREKITEKELQHGDEILISRYKYVFKSTLRPLHHKKAASIPLWFMAIAAMVILSILGTLGYFSAGLLQNKREFKYKIHKRVLQYKRKDAQSDQKSKFLVKDCIVSAIELQAQYRYKEALQEFHLYAKKIGKRKAKKLLASPIYQDIKGLGEFFEKLVDRLQNVENIEFTISPHGACFLQKATKSAFFIKTSSSLSIPVPWENISAEVLILFLDKTNFGKSFPLQTARFLLAHNIADVDKYLVQAFRGKDREKVQQLYVENIRKGIHPEEIVVYDEKIMTHGEMQALRNFTLQSHRIAFRGTLPLMLTHMLKSLRKKQREKFSLRYTIINEFVSTYSYKEAIDHFQNFAQELYDFDLKNKVQKRINELKDMLCLFDRMIESINKKRLNDDQVKFGKKMKGRLAWANRERFKIKIGANSFVEEKWYSLAPKDLYKCFQRFRLKSEEFFVLGKFCFENSLDDEGHNCLIAYSKSDTVARNRVNQYLAKHLGLKSIPSGGFVPFGKRLVTVEEKRNRDLGLVRYQGRWINPSYKKKLESGYRLREGRWIPQKEARLLTQGYRKYQGKWYKKFELDELRKNWEHAWEYKTKHYLIRSNVSEKFAKELANFMEEAYENYAAFFEKKVYERMKIYGFRNYEDYRRYCLTTGNADKLRAGGFATNLNNTGVGWMRTKPAQLLRTMSHEGAHLFHYLAYPRASFPSWFAEGIATQFEGYQWQKNRLQYDFISKTRLQNLKWSFARNQEFSVLELIQGNALKHINRNPRKAATFYAQSWGLYHYLWRKAPPSLRRKFQKFVKKMNRGICKGREAQSFEAIFQGRLLQIEKEWKKYMLKMNPVREKVSLSFYR